MSSTHCKIQRALDQIRHTLPETVKSRLLSSSEDINPILVSIEDSSEGVMCVVPVCVSDAVGYYCVNVHKVFVEVRTSEPGLQPFYSLDSWDILSPTGFECLGGKERNRKWRISIRVVTEDGCEGKPLGQWLKDHDLEGLIPDYCVSSPKKTLRNASNTVSKSNKGALEARKSPTKRKTSPVKKTTIKSPNKGRGFDRGHGTQSQRHVYDVNASFSIASFKDFLPVVKSGTPVMGSAWDTMHEQEPSPLPWLSEANVDNMSEFEMKSLTEEDMWKYRPSMEPFETGIENEDLVPFDETLSKLLDL